MAAMNLTNDATLIDMHNRIAADRLEKLLRGQVKALLDHPELAKVLPPTMIWGAPGLGKSSIIKGIADELGIGFIDVRLSQREPVDVRGLPVPNRETKSVEWMVSSEWPREGKGILLFDELTAADRSLQVAAYELILDRRLGDLYSVPDGWYICAAGNRVEDAAVATTMSSALSNRFMHVELVGDAEVWANWAKLHGIHPSVIGFLKFRPQFLLNQKDENLERGWPSPRSWERVSVMLNVLGDKDESLLRTAVYGLVGNRVGGEFLEFHKTNASFADVRKMMMDPKAAVVIPKESHYKYTMCVAMAYYVWRGHDDVEAKKLLDGFYRISLKFTSDFAVMVMVDAMSGGGVLSETEAAERLYKHDGQKAWKAWVAVHGAEMQKYRKAAK